MGVKLHCLEKGDQKIPSLCMFATKITPSKQLSPERRFGDDNIQASAGETEVCEKVEPTEGSDHAALPWHKSSVVFGVGKFKVSFFFKSILIKIQLYHFSLLFPQFNPFYTPSLLN